MKFLLIMLTIMAFSGNAFAGYKMIIHKVSYKTANGFQINNDQSQSGGLYINSDPTNDHSLMQPHVVVEHSLEGISAGATSVQLIGSKGKKLTYEKKGLLAEPFGIFDDLIMKQSFVLMFIKAGPVDDLPEANSPRPSQPGLITGTARISPQSFGKGSKLILSFSGKLPDDEEDRRQTNLYMNATRWGSGSQDQNFDFTQIINSDLYEDLQGKSQGGASQIEIEFELVETP